MNKKTKVVLSSIAAIAMSASLITGGTFALFTSESDVNIAVTSGKVDVTAKVEEVKTYSMGEEQTGTSFANGGEVIFNDNTLTLSKITPGDKAVSKISITNNSTVKVQYRVKIDCTDGYVLMGGLRFIVGNSVTDGEVSGTDYSSVSSYTSDWSSLYELQDVADVYVSLELPQEAGNEYQELTTNIRYTVEAVQGNASVEGGEQIEYIVTQREPVGEEQTVLTNGDFNVTVPTTAVEEGNASISLVISNIEDGNFNIAAEESDKLVGYNITVTGLKEDNDNLIIVELPAIPMGLSDVQIYHNAVPMTELDDVSVEAEGFYYNTFNGVVTIKTKSFSPFAVKYSVNNGFFSGGMGTTEYPYLISTKQDILDLYDHYLVLSDRDAELQGLYSKLFYRACYKMTNNIDISDTPIRNLGEYQCLFDGNGYTLTVNFTSASEIGMGNNVGMFAGFNGSSSTYIYEATTEEEINSPYSYTVNGKTYMLTAGTIRDLTIRGSVYSNLSGVVSPLGGGRCTGYVINVTNYATVTAEGSASFISGIVSGVKGTGLVMDCKNYGDITYTGTPSGSVVVGGIAAQLYGGSNGGYPDILRPYSASVYNCENYGNISASGRDVGGIVGQTHGGDFGLKKAILNCTNSGNISGKENVGGIIGRNNSTGKTLNILDCTNSGIVGIMEGGVEGTAGYIYGANYGVLIEENNKTILPADVKIGEVKFVDNLTYVLPEGTLTASANEQLNIRANNVTLKGAGAGLTTIDCLGYSCSGQAGILVGGNNVTISDLTVKTSSEDGNVSAIKYSAIDDASVVIEGGRIANVEVIASKGHGINLHGVKNVSLDNVSISNYSKCAISLAKAENVKLSRVTTQDTGWADIGMMYKADEGNTYNAPCSLFLGEGNNFGEQAIIYSERPATATDGLDKVNGQTGVLQGNDKYLWPVA